MTEQGTGAPSRRARIQLFGGFALGLGLLAWFLAGLRWNELWVVLLGVDPGWIALAVVAMLFDYVLHAWRWGVLLRDVDPDIDFATLWSATAVGWAFNTLLPLRAGNLLRPAVVALKRRVSYATLLFTTVAEYVCDTFGILVMILWMIWLVPADMTESGPLADLEVWGSAAAVGALALLAAVILLGTRRARSLVVALLAPVPSATLRERLIEMFDQIVAGMAAVGRPIRLLQALAITLAIWLSWLVAILCTLRAFSIELPLAGALFMEAALTLSMLVPQAPGFLGVFQVVTEEALSLWGTPAAEAQGIALVFWTVCFVPITVWGVIEGWRQGVDVLGGRRAVMREIEDAARQ